MGKKPIYAPLSELAQIQNEPARDITLAGTIFLRDTLLFVLEKYQGVHVYNLRDSANSVNLTFFKIPAITDFTLDGNILYADSWRDLVGIDISNLNEIKPVSRVKNVFEPPLFPPLYEGFFECVDESKGAVVGWGNALLTDAKCNTF